MADRNAPDAREIAFGLRELLASTDRYRQAAAGELGIGVAEVVALGDLFQYGPLTPKVIADRLGITSASVTAMLDRLQAAGYAIRTPHPTDRRSVLISPTESGLAAVDWFFSGFEVAIAEATATAGPGRRRYLAAFINDIARAMRGRCKEPRQSPG